MTPLPPSPLSLRALAWAPFVVSAALVALAVHVALREPWLGAGVGALAALVVGPKLVARQRVKRLLKSGDVDAVLSLWGDALERVPHRETMQPLIVATALAAHGMTDRARAALARAEHGAAWEAALEHRLFVETLLDAFEGDRELAVSKAERLAQLPLPPTGPFVRERVAVLRVAVGALARAFAHCTEPRDVATLERAASLNPLVHWPMRYAAAVACIDHGQRAHARSLLADAPEWPADSAFNEFHAELWARAGGAALSGTAVPPSS